jgi:hypothetical protein
MGVVSLTPSTGRAVLDTFLIAINGEVDQDAPFTYKFGLYLSKEHLE